VKNIGTLKLYNFIYYNKQCDKHRGDYMTTTFLSNTIWYILLGISTLIEMILILKKAKNKKRVIALFLIIAGMTFSFEAVTYCFLRAYDYYPMIIPQSPIDDGLAGNLFSQFSITTTALLIAVLNLKYHWFFVFAVIYGIIEELFLGLGIYSHNWYETWMTMLGLIPLFAVVKRLYKKYSIYTNSNIKRYFFMAFALFTLYMPTIFWIPVLTGIITPNTKILPDAMNSYVLICFLNLFVLSITCMIVYFSKLKWLLKSMIILALYFVIYFAYKINLIYVKEGWFLIFSSIDIWGMYLCIFIIDKLMPKD
jgi:hypothetical protein